MSSPMDIGASRNVISELIATISHVSARQLILYPIIFLVARFLIAGIYRVTFHKLRKYPGPFWNAFTRIPQILAITRGRYPHYTARLHAQYGEVVRLAPDELSFIGAPAWKDIYGYGSKEGEGKAPPKWWRWYDSEVGGTHGIVTQPDVKEHGRVRRMFAPAFSDRALTQQAPLFTKYVNQFCDVLRERCKDGKKVELVGLFNFTTFDVMGDLCFGEPLHMLDAGEYTPWVKTIFENVKASTLISILKAYYPIAYAMILLLVPEINKARMTHHNHSKTRVSKRLEKGIDEKGNDIWDLALSPSRQGKEGLSREEMDANAQIFMVAGTETTATLLSGLTYLLMKKPEMKKKLVEEVRGAFATSDDISMEAIQRLPYVNACIKEGLRLYPPVPSSLPHRTATQGSTICDHFVPPNVTVTSTHYAMYRSEHLFKDANEFHPERWLGDEKYANDERTALQPFHVGPRDCLGKNMAYHEMRLLLTKLIYNFNLVELAPESDNWIERQRVFTLWEKLPLMVTVKPVTA